MQNMLEQALVDASALKEAALENARETILEKYSIELKDAMSTLLEQEEEELMMDPAAADPLGDFDAPEASIADDQVEFGAVEDETACPCPEEGEVQVFNFNMDALRALEDEIPGLGGDVEGHEALVAEPGLGAPGAPPPEEEEEEVLPFGLQEELDVDEDILFEYPEEGTADENVDAEGLVERLVVELIGDELPGWAGRPGTDIEHAKEIRIARLAATDAKEQKEQLESAIENLAESNKKLTKENNNFKHMLVNLKEKLEEVNLSNAKLLYTNRTLSSASLNERQKSRIVESIQNADSVEEAKVIYETLQNAVGSLKKEPKSLREAIRRPSLSVPRKSARETQKDVLVKERFQRLAGISKN